MTQKTPWSEPMSDDMMTILEKTELFRGFGQEQLQKVISQLQPRKIELQVGDRLYKRGDPSDRCWLIQSGNLTAQRPSLRTPFRHMIYHAGSVTGIQGLADPGSPRAVSMIAEEGTELIEITYEGTERLDPEAQIKLWKNVARIMLRKLAFCLARESIGE